MKQGPHWLLQRAAQVPPGSDWLGMAERDHLAGLKTEKRRSDWLLGRWTAKQAISRDRGLGQELESLARLEVLPTSTGSPQAYIDGRALPMALSLSHREGAAICVVADSGAVGCDLEWVEDRSVAFVQDYFSRSERALIEARGDETRALTANGLWSAKESVLKLLGFGLRIDARSIEVRSFPLTTSEWQVFSVLYRPELRQIHGWWCRIENWILTVVSDAETSCPIGL